MKYPAHRETVKYILPSITAYKILLERRYISTTTSKTYGLDLLSPRRCRNSRDQQKTPSTCFSRLFCFCCLLAKTGPQASTTNRSTLWEGPQREVPDRRGTTSQFLLLLCLHFLPPSSPSTSPLLFLSRHPRHLHPPPSFISVSSTLLPSLLSTFFSLHSLSFYFIPSVFLSPLSFLPPPHPRYLSLSYTPIRHGRVRHGGNELGSE